MATRETCDVMEPLGDARGYRYTGDHQRCGRPAVVVVVGGCALCKEHRDEEARAAVKKPR